MKVPFSWLKEFVDIDVTAQELEEKLEPADPLNFPGYPAKLAVREEETGLSGPPDFIRPEKCKLGLYESWLMSRPDAGEAFKNLVSSFVFLLAREAFGRCEALDDFVCSEEVFA